MKRITISILFSASVLFVACGGRSASGSDSDVNPRDTVKVSASGSDSDVNPRDTVKVPEGYTGEDSIAYIENAVLKSNITAESTSGACCHTPKGAGRLIRLPDCGHAQPNDRQARSNYTL